MTCSRHPHDYPHAPKRNDGRSPWERWLVKHTMFAGLIALGWLVLRTGAKPSRVVYPCQQAAISTASLAFGAPLVAAIILCRRRAIEWV